MMNKNNQRILMGNEAMGRGDRGYFPPFLKGGLRGDY